MTQHDEQVGGHEVLFPSLPYDLKPRADRATADVKLQQFVNAATLLKDRARKQAMPQWFGERTDEVRDLAGRIKQHTLDHLDWYLQRFIANAEAAGATVHLARDADQANAIATAIAKEHDCRLCVKGKSMVTEEIRLLLALEAIGCETVETDLGEFIIQLDHDAPSHIVTPMIHKDRVAVAKAFERELGARYTEDPAELTMIAREHLREKYRRADLGVSGGNFLVAETGSVVICTNEGNGRFCTSAPRVHIAFVGIEKLVPTLEHLAVMLKVLARSSTAQPLTCYTHIMTGPKRDGETDGPRQMHIILLDNGRTDVLRPESREMLRCIRCGACLNACPVYRKIGGHAYGSVYPGPIGAILTPVLRGAANYPDLPHVSSLCGACYEACPVKINIPRHLIRLRGELIGRKVSGAPERLMYRSWARSLRSSALYKLGAWQQRKMFRALAKLQGGFKPADGEKTNPYTNRGWVRKLPPPFKGWTQKRDMPTPPSRSFRDWWHKRDL